MIVTREIIIEALANVVEPELKKDLVSLNFVEKIKIDENNISIVVYNSNPALHAKKRLKDAIEFNIKRFISNKSYSINTQIKPAPKREKKSPLQNIKQVIAVASGKGGVGKSTITANLACGLSKEGYKVGIIDADIYGPSMPTMFDVVNKRPKPVVTIDNEKKIEPINAHGIKLLSIGFFTEEENAIAWRGPMATRALEQLFVDAYWGELDFLLIDLPPGTGDIHLSLVQKFPPDGVIMVSTPQKIALADVKRGISMFQMDSINIPILGLIENMAWFSTEENPEEKHYLFGRDGAQNLANGLNIPFLGSVPIIQSIREAGDAGIPSVLQKNTLSELTFKTIVNTFIATLNTPKNE